MDAMMEIHLAHLVAQQQLQHDQYQQLAATGAVPPPPQYPAPPRPSSLPTTLSVEPSRSSDAASARHTISSSTSSLPLSRGQHVFDARGFPAIPRSCRVCGHRSRNLVKCHKCSLRVHQACVVLVPEQCPVPPELFTGGASHEPATDSRVDDSFPHAGQHERSLSPQPTGAGAEIDHVVFVVHGMGPHEKKTEQILAKLKSTRNEAAQLLGIRNCAHVEFITLEWHHPLRARTGDISALVPQSVGFVRNVINDTLMDVFYYMSPIYHPVILEAVGNQLNQQFEHFRQQHPAFQGGVSLLAHSLGSAICYDLMCRQPDPAKPPASHSTASTSTTSPSLGSDGSHPSSASSPPPQQQQPQQQPPPTGNIDRARSAKRRVPRGSDLACTSVGLASTPQCPTLSFPVQNMFLIGSPVPMLLAVRNEDRSNESLVLPRVCNMMNIFHENDPIAYRFEPWLDERYAHLDPVDLATGAVLRRQNRQTTLMQPHQTVSAVRQSSAVNTICNGARFDFRIPSTLGLLRHVGGEYVSLLKAHNCYWNSLEFMSALLEACEPEPKLPDLHWDPERPLSPPLPELHCQREPSRPTDVHQEDQSAPASHAVSQRGPALDPLLQRPVE